MAFKVVTIKITKEVYEGIEAQRRIGEFLPETLARVLQYGLERLEDLQAFQDDKNNDDRILIF